MAGWEEVQGSGNWNKCFTFKLWLWKGPSWPGAGGASSWWMGCEERAGGSGASPWQPGCPGTPRAATGKGSLWVRALA